MKLVFDMIILREKRNMRVKGLQSVKRKLNWRELENREFILGFLVDVRGSVN